MFDCSFNSWSPDKIYTTILAFYNDWRILSTVAHYKKLLDGSGIWALYPSYEATPKKPLPWGKYRTGITNKKPRVGAGGRYLVSQIFPKYVVFFLNTPNSRNKINFERYPLLFLLESCKSINKLSLLQLCQNYILNRIINPLNNISFDLLYPTTMCIRSQWGSGKVYDMTFDLDNITLQSWSN